MYVCAYIYIYVYMYMYTYIYIYIYIYELRGLGSKVLGYGVSGRLGGFKFRVWGVLGVEGTPLKP